MNLASAPEVTGRSASRRRPIGVVQGAPSTVIQPLFGQFSQLYRNDYRIAALIEAEPGPQGHFGLIDGIASSASYQLFQNLGPGSTACSLRGDGLAAACHDICKQIAKGCDLVLLSKFGKLEAERGAGLLSAFSDALLAGIPVLTSAAPKYDVAWSLFGELYFEILPATLTAIEQWWFEIIEG